MRNFLLLFFAVFTIAFAHAQCTDVIISKQFKFAGNTKAVEFYNTTASPINLTTGLYVIERYKSVSNFIDNIMDDSLHLTGIIPAHGTWILVNGQNAANSSTNSPQPHPALQAIANQLDHQYGTYGASVGQPMYFKGNDCLVLRKNGVIIDVFGEVNTTVTNAWSSIAPYRGDLGMGVWLTTGYLLERKSTVTSGRIPPVFGDLTSFSEFNPLAEYDTIPKILSFPTPTLFDTLAMFAHFGTHTCVCAPTCNLSITNQPQNQNAVVGNAAQFTFSASLTNVTYQWQTNIGFGFQNLSNAGQYSGVNQSTLTVGNLSMTNDNQVFRCIVTLSGNCTDTTNEVNLYVAPTVGIDNMELNKSYLYPNPTNDYLYILSSNVNNSNIEIMDAMGQIIHTGYLVINNQIEVKNLPNGTYVVRYNKTHYTKFMKY